MLHPWWWLPPRVDRGVDRSLKSTTTHQTTPVLDSSIRLKRPQILENPIHSPSQPTSYGADFHWVSVSSLLCCENSRKTLKLATHMDIDAIHLNQLVFDRKPISLISHSDVRYRGILAGIDPHASTIQLSNGEPLSSFHWIHRSPRPPPLVPKLSFSRVKCILWEPRRDGMLMARSIDRVDAPHSPFEQ